LLNEEDSFFIIIVVPEGEAAELHRWRRIGERTKAKM